MNELLKKDMTIKVFSVLLAMFLWLYVLNISNPYDDKKINVELKIENEDYLSYNNLKLINKINRNIEVYVRGRTDVVKNILPSDFDASVDFSKISSVNDKTLKINLEHNLKDVIIDMSPSSIKVELERIKTSSFPVEIEVKGNPKGNYKVIRSSVSPETVEFKNVESLVDTIGTVKAIIDIPKDLDRDFVAKKECVVYNKKGEIITDLSRNQSVEVMVEVAKEVPITLVTTGKLAEDHVEIARKLNPEKALIRGPHEVLSKIDELRTEPLSIENLKGNINTTIGINQQEGVTLINTPTEVSVNITVEQMEDKTFAISGNEINLLNAVTDDSLTYKIKTTEVEFRIRGKKSDLSSINLLSVKPRVDVGNLGEGTYKLPLLIDLPLGLRLLDSYEVEVIVSKIVE